MNCATTSQEDKGFNSKLVRIRSVRGAMNCATTSQEDKGFNSKLVEKSDYEPKVSIQTGGKIPELLRQLKHGGGSELKKRVKPAYQ